MFNRFLIVEGASHFSPIRINNENSNKKAGDDVFKINENFIGHDPNDVQNLAADIIIQFLYDLNRNKGLNIVKNQLENNLKFHILDNDQVRGISGN